MTTPIARLEPSSGSQSLTEAFADLALGRPCEVLATTSGRIRLCQRVADILAAAHAEGRIHGTLHPGCIHLDPSGGVRVDGWHADGTADWQHETAGTGAISRHGRVVSTWGTSSYLGPEVGRGEPASVASDIYALTAVLHHLVVGRPPLLSTTGTQSWTRKIAGTVDPLSDRERRVVPPAILAVVTHGLQPDPGQRQASMRELSEELEFALDAALARTIPPPETRRPRWPLAIAALAAALVVALLAFRRNPPPDAWGRPLLDETFIGAEWQSRWVTMDGTFSSQGGKLSTESGNSHILALRRRLSPYAAIEFEGMVAADARAGDLSVMWVSGDLDQLAAQPGGVHASKPIIFQTGGYDNSFAGIASTNRLAQSPFRLVPGRTYHIRTEIDGDRLTLAVDGTTICAAQTLFPLPAGTFALYGYYPGKVFSKVRVWSRRPPEQVSPLAIPDAMFSDGDYDRAERHYAELVQAFGQHPLSQAALFRLGLARDRRGDTAGAEQIWLGLQDTPWEGRVLLATGRARLQSGLPVEAVTLSDRVHRLDPALGSQAVELWSAGVLASLGSGDLAGLDGWLASWRGRFPDDPLAQDAVGQALLAAKRSDEVLKQLPHNKGMVAMALVLAGDTDRVLGEFASERFAVFEALNQRGDYDRILKDFPDQEWAKRRAMILMGRAIAINSPYADDLAWRDLTLGRPEAALSSPIVAMHARALIAVDRLAEAEHLLQAEGRSAEDRQLADRVSLLNGHAAEVLDSARRRGVRNLEAEAMSALNNLRSGDSAAATRVLDALNTVPGLANECSLEIGSCLLPALAHLQEGGAPAARRFLEMVMAQRRMQQGQRTWHLAAFILGRIDEAEFCAQPMQIGIDGSLLLATAVAAELYGDAISARRAYARWQELPLHRRSLERDAVAEALVAYKLTR